MGRGSDIITIALTEAGVTKKPPSLDWVKKRNEIRQARAGAGMGVG